MLTIDNLSVLIKTILQSPSTKDIKKINNEIQKHIKPIEIKIDQNIINTLNKFVASLDKVKDISTKINKVLSEEVKITQELNGITTKTIKQQMTDGSIIVKTIETTNKAKQKSIELAQKELQITKATNDQIRKIETLNSKFGSTVAVTSGTKNLNSRVNYDVNGDAYSEKINENIVMRQADNYNKIKKELSNILLYRKELLKLSGQDNEATDYWKKKLQESGAIIKNINQLQIKTSEGTKESALAEEHLLKVKEQIKNVQNQIANETIKQKYSSNNITTVPTFKGDVLTTSSNLAGNLITEKNIAQELTSIYKGLEIREVSLDKATGKWTATIKENTTQNRKLKGELDSVNGSLYKHSDALVQAKNINLGFTQQLKIAIERTMIWASAMTVFYGSFRAVQSGISYLNDLDNAMNQVRIVTGMSADEAVRLGKEYNKLAKEMSVTTTEVANASVEFARQGLSQEEIKNRLKETIKYAKISGLEFKEAAEIMTATVNSMNIDIERATDVFSYLGDATATGKHMCPAA